MKQLRYTDVEYNCITYTHCGDVKVIVDTGALYDETTEATIMTKRNRDILILLTHNTVVMTFSEHMEYYNAKHKK
jgi:hypothetical protein